MTFKFNFDFKNINKEVETISVYTHSGIFHADEIFCVALLKLISHKEVKVNRVFSVPEGVENAPDKGIYVLDIGCGELDHHSFPREERNNGVPYASFGKLIRYLGINELHGVENFDEKWGVPIDRQDNGGEVNLLSQSIGAMNPLWNEEEGAEECFNKAVNFALELLSRDFEARKATLLAEKEVNKALAKSENGVVILDHFMPWQEALIPTEAKVVIFPSLRGGYTVQLVPKKLGERETKVSFPKEWWGSNALPSGMSFCHATGFMLVANELEDAIKFANLAQ